MSYKADSNCVSQWRVLVIMLLLIISMFCRNPLLVSVWEPFLRHCLIQVTCYASPIAPWHYECGCCCLDTFIPAITRNMLGEADTHLFYFTQHSQCTIIPPKAKNKSSKDLPLQLLRTGAKPPPHPDTETMTDAEKEPIMRSMMSLLIAMSSRVDQYERSRDGRQDYASAHAVYAMEPRTYHQLVTAEDRPPR